MSPYPEIGSPDTVLGVALPSISRFLRLISSRARSLSDISREIRARTSGGLSDIEAADEGRLKDLEEPSREASCLVMDVKGS